MCLQRQSYISPFMPPAVETVCSKRAWSYVAQSTASMNALRLSITIWQLGCLHSAASSHHTIRGRKRWYHDPACHIVSSLSWSLNTIPHLVPQTPTGQDAHVSVLTRLCQNLCRSTAVLWVILWGQKWYIMTSLCPCITLKASALAYSFRGHNVTNRHKQAHGVFSWDRYSHHSR